MSGGKLFAATKEIATLTFYDLAYVERGVVYSRAWLSDDQLFDRTLYSSSLHLGSLGTGLQAARSLCNLLVWRRLSMELRYLCEEGCNIVCF
jgi:hypothetical protein